MCIIQNTIGHYGIFITIDVSYWPTFLCGIVFENPVTDLNKKVKLK